MANAILDGNGIPTLIAVNSSNGTDIVRIKVDSVTHGLKISDGTTGTDFGPSRALRDENYKTTWIGVSSSDGQTPVAMYGNSSGNLLVKST